MKFVVVGLSHHTAPIEVRERLARATTPVQSALTEICRTTGIKEVCLVTTCNRVEIFASGDDAGAALGRDLRDFVIASCGLSPGDIEPHLVQREGVEALAHLFRVASSLDSMVLGEPQILGQVKQAYGIACETKTVGPQLSRVFERAFAVAKRVRSETGIAENAVSMSYAAVKLGREIFESLAGHKVLLIGAGKMSALAARHLRSHGIAEIRVANRSLERATQLAREIDALPSTLADLDLLLQQADIVISSTAAPGYVVTKALMSQVVRKRRYRPILLVDIAVPRDVEPEVQDLDNVFLYDVDDLASVVQDNRQARQNEATAAETIITHEVDSFVRWERSQQVVPVIKALRAHALGIAETEFNKSFLSLSVSDVQAERRLRAMSQAIVNKMLHPVLTKLKMEGAEGDPGPLVDAIKVLFDLNVEAAAPQAEEGEKADNVVPFSKEGG